MNNQSFPEDFDEIFERTLDATYDGPVPEAALHRLLSAVELVIRRELAQKELSQELAGLRVGYSFQDPDNVENEEVYWVGWGYHPTYDKMLEEQLVTFGKTVNYPNVSDKNVDFLSDVNVNFLSDNLARYLVHKLQEEMLCYTPDEILEGKKIYPFVFGHVVQLFVSPGIEFIAALSCPTICNKKPGIEPRNSPCHNNCYS